MILPFSQKFPDGSPTNFDLKIAKGLIENNIVDKNYTTPIPNDLKPKIHTIRTDEKDRWKPNNKIHPYYNCRQKNMRLISPVIPCISIQIITITHGFSFTPYLIKIDGKSLTYKECELLAVNDGFDSIEHFLSWFNKDYQGKIIHWTNFKY